MIAVSLETVRCSVSRSLFRCYTGGSDPGGLDGPICRSRMVSSPSAFSLAPIPPLCGVALIDCILSSYSCIALDSIMVSL